MTGSILKKEFFLSLLVLSSCRTIQNKNMRSQKALSLEPQTSHQGRVVKMQLVGETTQFHDLKARICDKSGVCTEQSIWDSKIYYPSLEPGSYTVELVECQAIPVNLLWLRSHLNIGRKTH